MQLHRTIALAAVLAALVIVWLSGNLVPGFVWSKQFNEAIYIEALSFVITVALVGSAWAMLTSYLEGRQMRPARTYASERMNRAAAQLVASLRRVLLHGIMKETRLDGLYIQSGQLRHMRYRKHSTVYLSECLDEFYASSRSLMADIERYFPVFPPSAQNELIGLEQHIARVEEVLTVVQAHVPQSLRNTVELDASDLKRAAALLGAEIDQSGRSESRFVRIGFSRDHKSGWVTTNKLPSERESWVAFFESIRKTFGPYLKSTSKFSADNNLIDILGNMRTLALKAVLYADPGNDPMPRLDIERRFPELTREIDFAEELDEVEEKILAVVPRGVIVDGDGLFEIEQFCRMPDGLAILSKIQPYVKHNRYGDYKKLLEQARQCQPKTA